MTKNELSTRDINEARLCLNCKLRACNENMAECLIGITINTRNKCYASKRTCNQLADSHGAEVCDYLRRAPDSTASDIAGAIKLSPSVVLQCLSTLVLTRSEPIIHSGRRDKNVTWRVI